MHLSASGLCSTVVLMIIFIKIMREDQHDYTDGYRSIYCSLLGSSNVFQCKIG